MSSAGRPARCVVPGSHGASFTREGEEALWAAYSTVAPARRREFEPSSKHRKSRLGPWPRYGLNPKTVSKWRHRTTTADAPMGPRHVHSAALSPLEEAAVIEFRRRTLLPLDDVLGCLREQLPQLSRSALHRCLLCHGISRLPPSPEHASKRGHSPRRRSATCTLMPANCGLRRAKCTCSSPSTG